MRYSQVSRSLNFNVLRVGCYYLQRGTTHPVLRSLAIGFLRRVVGGAALRAKPGPDGATALAALRRDGIASLGQLMSDAQCAQIVDYLADKPLTHKALSGAAFLAASPPSGARLGDHALGDLVHCPSVMAFANDPALLALAHGFLGCTPTISGLSARWSFPSDEGAEVVQLFHRDSEDWRAFRVMVYLTDVTERSGPHAYVKATHNDRRRARMPVFAPEEVAGMYDAGRIVRQTGHRGAGFAVDTAGLHRGEVPRDAARLMLSVQYSILPCFLYEYAPVPVSGMGFDRYVNRLICLAQ